MNAFEKHQLVAPVCGSLVSRAKELQNWTHNLLALKRRPLQYLAPCSSKVLNYGRAQRIGSNCLFERDSVLSAIAFYLREPIASTQQILKKNVNYVRRNEEFRNKKQSLKRLNSQLNSFEFIDRENYLQLQSCNQSSRIVCSFHFGDFIYGLNALMCLESPSQKRIFHSQQRASKDYFHNIKLSFGDRAVLDKNQLTTSASNVLQILYQLRVQPTTLVMFCDLPGNFGQSCEVSFLGRKAFFPRGVATLGLCAQIPIIPAISFSVSNTNYVKVFAPISPVKAQDETREKAVSRIIQDLVCILESFVQLFPYQWKFLQALPNYFYKAT